MGIEINLDLDLYAEEIATQTVPALQSVEITEVTKDNFLFGEVEFFVYSKILPTQILTPTQPSTGEPVIGNLGANMVNGNLFDLSYNNFGSASGYDLPFYTFDFGAPIANVDLIRIKWWQFNNYVANDFRIEAANVWNPVPVPGDWTTIIDNLTGTNIVGSIQDILIVNATPFQYWRMYVNEPFPANQIFVVVGEIEVFSAGTQYQSIESSDEVDMYFNSAGKLVVVNNGNVNTQLRVRYRKPNA